MAFGRVGCAHQLGSPGTDEAAEIVWVVVKFKVVWLCDVTIRTLTVFAIPGTRIPAIPAGMTGLHLTVVPGGGIPNGGARTGPRNPVVQERQAIHLLIAGNFQQ